MKKYIITIGLTLLVVVLVAIMIPAILGYKIIYYTNVLYDYDAIMAVAQIIGVVVSAVLTGMIMRQSRVIAKNQLEFEKTSSANQLQFQKISALNQEIFQRRQIRIDLYEKRVIIFEWVFKLFTNISIIIKLQKGEEYFEQNFKQVISIFKYMKTEDKHDVYSLHRAEYLFTKNLAVKMRRIFELYTEIGAIVTISSEIGFNLTKFNQEFYDQILKMCNEILTYQNFVNNACDEILNIAEFDRI